MIQLHDINAKTALLESAKSSITTWKRLFPEQESFFRKLIYILLENPVCERLRILPPTPCGLNLNLYWNALCNITVQNSWVTDDIIYSVLKRAEVMLPSNVLLLDSLISEKMLQYAMQNNLQDLDRMINHAINGKQIDVIFGALHFPSHWGVLHLSKVLGATCGDSLKFSPPPKLLMVLNRFCSYIGLPTSEKLSRLDVPSQAGDSSACGVFAIFYILNSLGFNVPNVSVPTIPSCRLLLLQILTGNAEVMYLKTLLTANSQILQLSWDPQRSKYENIFSERCSVSCHEVLPSSSVIELSAHKQDLYENVQTNAIRISENEAANLSTQQNLFLLTEENNDISLDQFTKTHSDITHFEPHDPPALYSSKVMQLESNGTITNQSENQCYENDKLQNAPANLQECSFVEALQTIFPKKWTSFDEAYNDIVPLFLEKGNTALVRGPTSKQRQRRK